MSTNKKSRTAQNNFENTSYQINKYSQIHNCNTNIKEIKLSLFIDTTDNNFEKKNMFPERSIFEIYRFEMKGFNKKLTKIRYLLKKNIRNQDSTRKSTDHS